MMIVVLTLVVWSRLVSVLCWLVELSVMSAWLLKCVVRLCRFLSGLVVCGLVVMSGTGAVLSGRIGTLV